MILSVWVIYILPNDKNKQKEVQRIITKNIVKKRKNKYFILGRDFNHMLNSITNQIGVLTYSKIQKFSLTSWLSKIGFIEIYKYYNPQGEKFT